MSEISIPLSADEETVLTIAAEGQNMMAIGRWEKPCDRLVSLGYLAGQDRFNLCITTAGKRALENVQNDNIDQVIALSGQVNAVQSAVRTAIETAAHGLADIARRSSAVTGDRPSNAALQWGKVLVEKAVSILESGHD